MATLAAWWAAEVDAAGPVRVATTVIGLLCASVWVHRAQVDRWIQTHFDRAFHVDTGAVAPHIAAARHKAWWTGTAVPLLRVTVCTVFAVFCACAVLYGDFLAGTDGTFLSLLLEVLLPGGAMVCAIGRGDEASVVLVHRAIAVGIPAVRFLFAMWPTTSDAYFRLLLANAILGNTFIATFTTASFSDFLVWRLGPSVFVAVHRIPALHAMPRPQVAVLCAGAIGAAVVHPCVRAWHRQRLYAPLVAGEDA